MKKEIFRYFKNRILLMCTFAICSFVIFFSNAQTTNANDGFQNAYLCTFVDDTSNTYRTQVLYTGEKLEIGNVTHLFPNFALNSRADSKHRVRLYDVYDGWQRGIFANDTPVIYGGKKYATKVSIKNGSTDKGLFNIDLIDTETSTTLTAENRAKIKIYDDTMSYKNGSSNAYYYSYSPCTFPFADRNAKASDINRAYEVQDALSSDFNDALLYINDGKNFTHPKDLIETAYFVCTSGDDVVITNLNGNQYRLHWELKTLSELDAKNPPSVYELKITNLTDNKSKTFTYSVKKGYRNCVTGEMMESGNSNTLVRDETLTAYDTEYVTWEHLYANAGVLYAKGITYANQGDIFNLSDMESKTVDMVRNLLGGLRSMLQLYTMEDCIFNNGIRGSSAFVFGIYNESWNGNIGRIYMIFSAITVSLIAFSIIKLVIARQLSSISPAMKISLIDGIKNILISLMFIAFAYLFFKFVFIINFEFVNIFTQLIGNKKLAEAGSYSTLASIIYQFAYFIISIYVNFVYIMRGLIVPFLMMIAPICLYAFSLGKGGQKITETWAKEFLGYVFIQSIHAFVYGFCLISSIGLRGIESIILCASIIPLTSIARDIMGVGGGKLLDTATKLTTGSTMAGIGVATAGIGLAGNVLGGVASATGNVIGGKATAIGSAIGSVTKSVGNIASSSVGALAGAGLSTGLGTEDNTALTQGANITNNGVKGLNNEFRNISNNASGFVGSHGEDINKGIGNANASVRNFNNENISSLNGVTGNASGNSQIGRGFNTSASRSVTNNAVSTHQQSLAEMTARRDAMAQRQEANQSIVDNYHANRIMSGGSLTSLSRDSSGNLSGEFNVLSKADFGTKHNLSGIALDRQYEAYNNSLSEYANNKDLLARSGFSINSVDDGKYRVSFNNTVLNRGVLTSTNDTDGGFNAHFRCQTKDEFAKSYVGDASRLDNNYNNYRTEWNNQTRMIFGNGDSRQQFCENSFARKGFVDNDNNGNSVVTMKF